MRPLRGVDAINVAVAAGNDPARRTYEAAGFVAAHHEHVVARGPHVRGVGAPPPVALSQVSGEFHNHWL